MAAVLALVVQASSGSPLQRGPQRHQGRWTLHSQVSPSWGESVPSLLSPALVAAMVGQ